MSKPNALHEIIRRGYREGLTPREIAEEAGSTVGSVKVIAHRLGVNDRPAVAARKRAQRSRTLSGWLA